MLAACVVDKVLPPPRRDGLLHNLMAYLVHHPDLAERAHLHHHMPTRKRSRAHATAYRITAERRINETRIAEERQQQKAWLAATYEPPPF